MGILGRDDAQRREELPGELAGLELDFEPRRCPECGEQFPSWRSTCPDDGAPLATTGGDGGGQPRAPRP